MSTSIFYSLFINHLNLGGIIMYSALCIVSVNYFTQGSLDKNGMQPIILNIVAGKAPNRTVISGTVAERAGFEVGKTYLATCREVEPDATYGRQFRWTKLTETTALDVIKGSKELGEAQMFDAGSVDATAHSSVEAEAAAELAGKK